MNQAGSDLLGVSAADQARFLRWPWLVRQRPRRVFEALADSRSRRVWLTEPRRCPICGVGRLEAPENGEPQRWCVRRNGRGCGVVVTGVGRYWVQS